jgi:hypothetical protein
MAATAVGTMLIVGMATVIIISLPIMTSSVNAAAIVLDLAMAVATTMATIIGTRGNDGGAASGREHGGAAGNKKSICWGFAYCSDRTYFVHAFASLAFVGRAPAQ